MTARPPSAIAERLLRTMRHYLRIADAMQRAGESDLAERAGEIATHILARAIRVQVGR